MKNGKVKFNGGFALLSIACFAIGIGSFDFGLILWLLALVFMIAQVYVIRRAYKKNRGAIGVASTFLILT